MGAFFVRQPVFCCGEDVLEIDRLKEKILRYYGKPNWSMSVYDKTGNEIHKVFIFNRSPEFVNPQSECKSLAGFSYTVKKITISEWVSEKFHLKEEHANYLVNEVLQEKIRI